MRTALVLLPSPLLGPAMWAPAAEGLRERGWEARISGLPAAPRTSADVTEGFRESLPADADLVLVAHSNAGLFLPILGQQRRVVAHVFVDAALPPAVGSTTLAPQGLYDFLAGRADEEGLLPPWTEWWEDSDVDGLFPSEQVRRRVELEQPRIPLAYFRSSVEVPTGWTDIPSAYIAFGDTYLDELRQAESWDWPVTTLTGRHLHMLVDPDSVITAVTEKLAELDVGAGT